MCCSSSSRRRCGIILVWRRLRLASLAIADLNALLMVVASWLLVAMRRIGAGLMLASTVLVAGYARSPGRSAAPLLCLADTCRTARAAAGGGNLVLHIAATVYAFRLNSKGLLR